MLQKGRISVLIPPFARNELPTPALVVDRGALDRNIETLAEWVASREVSLRPHAKTHKSGKIALRQIAAGAVGVCCAKLGEAEALADEGVADILITSPVVSAGAVARLVELNRRVKRLAVVADHPENVDRLASAFGGRVLRVLVDIDAGTIRTGVTSPEAAVALAGQIERAASLQYDGVQFYCGAHQHIASLQDRENALAASAADLRRYLDALDTAGLPAAIVTGGGTGSLAIDLDLDMLTELQPGSYIFMDRQYRECELSGPTFEVALEIDTRVISANTPGRATIDAGIKAMATEAGAPEVLRGAHPASMYMFMGDEHGLLVTPTDAEDPGLDQIVTIMTPHCDPTVNLYDRYAVCEGDTVVEWWPINARGRSA